MAEDFDYGYDDSEDEDTEDTSWFTSGWGDSDEEEPDYALDDEDDTGDSSYGDSNPYGVGSTGYVSEDGSDTSDTDDDEDSLYFGSGWESNAPDPTVGAVYNQNPKSPEALQNFQSFTASHGAIDQPVAQQPTRQAPQQAVASADPAAQQGIMQAAQATQQYDASDIFGSNNPLSQPITYESVPTQAPRSAPAGSEQGWEGEDFARMFDQLGQKGLWNEAPVGMGTPDPRSATTYPGVGSDQGGQVGAQPGEIEAYIRQEAIKRNINPDTAVAVARSEGGLDDPYRQSNATYNGHREESYGPLQLHMEGGLGASALQQGIDPRKDWKSGVQFALDNVAQSGWGPWNGAKKIGVTGKMGAEAAKPIGIDRSHLTTAQTPSFSAQGTQLPTQAAAAQLPAPKEMHFDNKYNRGTRPQTDGIVVHSTRGGAANAQQEFDRTVGYFQDNDRNVSANAVIGPDGTIAYFGDPNIAANHAGEENVTKYGIELAQTTPDAPYTDAQYKSLAWLTQQVSSKYNIPINRQAIRGHDEIQQGINQGKSDPGANFDWNKYMSLAAAPKQTTQAAQPQAQTRGPAGSQIVQNALNQYKGGTYTFGGGRDSQGFGVPGQSNYDCSSFVSAVWKQNGVNLPAHTDAAYQFLLGEGRYQGQAQGFRVPEEEAQPGDVVFYMGAGTGGAITHHMGIYAGPGKVYDMSTSGGGGMAVRDINHAGQHVVIRDNRVNGNAPGVALPAPQITPSGGNAERGGGMVRPATGIGGRPITLWDIAYGTYNRPQFIPPPPTAPVRATAPQGSGGEPPARGNIPAQPKTPTIPVPAKKVLQPNTQYEIVEPRDTREAVVPSGGSTVGANPDRQSRRQDEATATTDDPLVRFNGGTVENPVYRVGKLSELRAIDEQQRRSAETHNKRVDEVAAKKQQLEAITDPDAKAQAMYDMAGTLQGMGYGSEAQELRESADGYFASKSQQTESVEAPLSAYPDLPGEHNVYNQRPVEELNAEEEAQRGQALDVAADVRNQPGVAREAVRQGQITPDVLAGLPDENRPTPGTQPYPTAQLDAMGMPISRIDMGTNYVERARAAAQNGTQLEVFNEIMALPEGSYKEQALKEYARGAQSTQLDLEEAGDEAGRALERRQKVEAEASRIRPVDQAAIDAFADDGTGTPRQAPSRSPLEILRDVATIAYNPFDNNAVERVFGKGDVKTNIWQGTTNAIRTMTVGGGADFIKAVTDHRSLGPVNLDAVHDYADSVAVNQAAQTKISSQGQLMENIGQQKATWLHERGLDNADTMTQEAAMLADPEMRKLRGIEFGMGALQIVPQVIGMAVATAITGGAAEAIMAGRVASGATSAIRAARAIDLVRKGTQFGSVFGMEAGGMATQLTERGLSSNKVLAISIPVGIGNALLENSELGRIIPFEYKPRVANLIEKEAKTHWAAEIANRGIGVVNNFYSEGTQEVLQQIHGNVWQKTFDPKSDLWEGVVDSFFVGGAGGGAGAVFGAHPNIAPLQSGLQGEASRPVEYGHGEPRPLAEIPGVPGVPATPDLAAPATAAAPEARPLSHEEQQTPEIQKQVQNLIRTGAKAEDLVIDNQGVVWSNTDAVPTTSTTAAQFTGAQPTPITAAPSAQGLGIRPEQIPNMAVVPYEREPAGGRNPNGNPDYQITERVQPALLENNPQAVRVPGAIADTESVTSDTPMVAQVSTAVQNMVTAQNLARQAGEKPLSPRQLKDIARQSMVLSRDDENLGLAQHATNFIAKYGGNDPVRQAQVAEVVSRALTQVYTPENQEIIKKAGPRDAKVRKAGELFTQALRQEVVRPTTAQQFKPARLPQTAAIPAGEDPDEFIQRQIYAATSNTRLYNGVPIAVHPNESQAVVEQLTRSSYNKTLDDAAAQIFDQVDADWGTLLGGKRPSSYGGLMIARGATGVNMMAPEDDNSPNQIFVNIPELYAEAVDFADAHGIDRNSDDFKVILARKTLINMVHEKSHDAIRDHTIERQEIEDMVVAQIMQDNAPAWQTAQAAVQALTPEQMQELERDFRTYAQASHPGETNGTIAGTIEGTGRTDAIASRYAGQRSGASGPLRQGGAARTAREIRDSLRGLSEEVPENTTALRATQRTAAPGTDTDTTRDDAGTNTTRTASEPGRGSERSDESVRYTRPSVLEGGLAVPKGPALETDAKGKPKSRVENQIFDTFVEAAEDSPDNLPHLSSEEMAKLPNASGWVTGEAVFDKKGHQVRTAGVPHRVPSLDALRALRDAGLSFKNWYTEMGDRAAQEVGRTNVAEWAAIMGITSAQTTVLQNIQAAIHTMRIYRELAARNELTAENVTGDTGMEKVKFAMRTGSKLDQIWNAYNIGRFLSSGPKTPSYGGHFVEMVNRLFDPNVTNDFWMARVFGDLEASATQNTLSDKIPRYRYATATVQWLAAEIGVQPNEAQAALWVAMNQIYEHPAAREQNLLGRLKSGEIDLAEAVQLGSAAGIFDVPNSGPELFDHPNIQAYLTEHRETIRKAGPLKATEMRRTFVNTNYVVSPEATAAGRTEAERQAPFVGLNVPREVLEEAGLNERGQLPWITAPHQFVFSDNQAHLVMPGANLEAMQYHAALIGERTGMDEATTIMPTPRGEAQGIIVNKDFTPQEITKLQETFKGENIPAYAGTTNNFVSIPNVHELEDFGPRVMEILNAQGIDSRAMQPFTGVRNVISKSEFGEILQRFGDRYRPAVTPDIQARGLGQLQQAATERGYRRDAGDGARSAPTGARGTTGAENVPDFGRAVPGASGYTAALRATARRVAPEATPAEVDAAVSTFQEIGPEPQLTVAQRTAHKVGSVDKVNPDGTIEPQMFESLLEMDVMDRIIKSMETGEELVDRTGRTFGRVVDWKAGIAHTVEYLRGVDPDRPPYWHPPNSRRMPSSVPIAMGQDTANIAPKNRFQQYRYAPDYVLNYRPDIKVLTVKDGKFKVWIIEPKSDSDLDSAPTINKRQSIMTALDTITARTGVDTEYIVASYTPQTGHWTLNQQEMVPVGFETSTDTTRKKMWASIVAGQKEGWSPTAGSRNGLSAAPFGVKELTKFPTAKSGSERVRAKKTFAALRTTERTAEQDPTEALAILDENERFARTLPAAERDQLLDLIEAERAKLRPSPVPEFGFPPLSPRIQRRFEAQEARRAANPITRPQDAPFYEEDLEAERAEEARNAPFTVEQSPEYRRNRPKLEAVLPANAVGEPAGTPVYHGTTHEYDAVNPARFQSGIYGPGHYVTSNRLLAQVYEAGLYGRDRDLSPDAKPNIRATKMPDSVRWFNAEGRLQPEEARYLKDALVERIGQEEADNAISDAAIRENRVWGESVYKGLRESFGGRYNDETMPALNTFLEGLGYDGIYHYDPLVGDMREQVLQVPGVTREQYEEGDLDTQSYVYSVFPSGMTQFRNPKTGRISLRRSERTERPYPWNVPQQEISSADTSIRQVPALFKKETWQPGTRNLDIGGGRYDDATQHLAQQGVASHVFDPFNRDAEHNQAVLDNVLANPVDTATVANVLNVIREPEAQKQVLDQAYAALKAGGQVKIAVYEGDRSGRGKQTSKGWQNNRPTADYLGLVRQVFPDATVKNGVITATKRVTPIATGLISLRAAQRSPAAPEWTPELAAIVAENRRDWSEKTARMPEVIETWDSEDFNRLYEAKREWDHAARIGLSLGTLKPADAVARGWMETREDEIVDLPPTLYHVTTALQPVLEKGLRNREELGQQQGKGLGGGPESTISFTHDPEIARQIHTAVLEARQVARGEITAQDMVQQARDGGYADELIPAYERSWGSVEKIGDDAKQRFEFYKWFATYREQAGGPMNPLFFSTDVEGLASTNPEDIGIVEATMRPGSYGTQLHALGEWRAFSGAAVQSVRDVTKGDAALRRTERRVYHGTQNIYDQVDPGKFDKTGLYGPAHYVTDNPQVADSYSLGGSGSTIQDIQNTEAIYNAQIRNLENELKKLLTDRKAYVAKIQMRDKAATPASIRKDINEDIESIRNKIEILHEQMGSANTRFTNLPENINLLDVTEDINDKDDLRSKLAVAIRKMYPKAITGVINQQVQSVVGSMPFGAVGEENYSVGDDLYAALVKTFPNKKVVNQILAGMGYDGIAYPGGQIMALADKDGKEIKHQAYAIFPEGMEKFRNPTTGRIALRRTERQFNRYGNLDVQPDPFNDGMWRTVNRSTGEVVTEGLTEQEARLQGSQEALPRRGRRVYHGTTQQYDRVNPENFDPGALYGDALYLTEDPRLAESYALGGHGSTAEDLSRLQQRIADLEERITRDRAEALADPDLRDYITQGLEDETHIGELKSDLSELRNEFNEMASGNIRFTNLPTNINLLDVEEPIDTYDTADIKAKITRGIQAVFPDAPGLLDRRVSNITENLGIDETQDDDYDSGIEMTGDDLYGALLQSFPSKSVVNKILAGMGYDGIAYPGGQVMALQDNDGNDIEHQAYAIFKEGLEKFRTPITGDLTLRRTERTTPRQTDIPDLGAMFAPNIALRAANAPQGAPVPAPTPRPVPGVVPNFNIRKFSAAARPEIQAAANMIHQSGQSLAQAAQRAALDNGFRTVADYQRAFGPNLTDIERAAVAKVLADRRQAMFAEAQRLQGNMAAGGTPNAPELASFIKSGMQYMGMHSQYTGDPKQLRKYGAPRFTEAELNRKKGESQTDYEKRLIQAAHLDGIWSKNPIERGKTQDLLNHIVDGFTQTQALGVPSQGIYDMWGAVFSPKGRLIDVFDAAMYSSILGPQSAINAVWGNTFNIPFKWLEDIFQSLTFDNPLHYNPLQTFQGEFIGNLYGIKHALHAAWDAVVHNANTANNLDADVTRATNMGGPAVNIPGTPIDFKPSNVPGHIFQVWNRFFVGADAFARAIVYHMELGRLAGKEAQDLAKQNKTQWWGEFRALYDNPTPEMMRAAAREARYAVFQADMGNMGKAAQQVQRVPVAGRALMPFLKTTYNIMSQNIDRSPIGIFATAFDMIKNPEYRHGTDTNSVNAPWQQRMSRGIVGTAMLVGLTQLIRAGIITLTGKGPDDKDERRLWLTENQPFSFRIKDGPWQSYGALNVTIPLIALAEMQDGIKAGVIDFSQDNISNLASAFVQGTLDNSFLSTITRLIAASQADQAEGIYKMRGAVSGLLTNRVPLLATGDFVARAFEGDNTARYPVAANNKSIIDSQYLQQSIMARTPNFMGMRQQVPQGTDMWGKPIDYGRAGIAVLFPWRTKNPEGDPVTNELLKMHQGLSAEAQADAERKGQIFDPSRVEHVAPAAPGVYKDTKHGIEHSFTPNEYVRWKELYGRELYRAATDAIHNPNWNSLPNKGDNGKAGKWDVLSDKYEEAKKKAWDQMGIAESPAELDGPPKYMLAPTLAKKRGITETEAHYLIANAITDVNAWQRDLKDWRIPKEAKAPMPDADTQLIAQAYSAINPKYREDQKKAKSEKTAIVNAELPNFVP